MVLPSLPAIVLRGTRWRPERTLAMLTDRFEADYLLETPIDPARAAEIMAASSRAAPSSPFPARRRS